MMLNIFFSLYLSISERNSGAHSLDINAIISVLLKLSILGQLQMDKASQLPTFNKDEIRLMIN